MCCLVDWNSNFKVEKTINKWNQQQLNEIELNVNSKEEKKKNKKLKRVSLRTNEQILIDVDCAKRNETMKIYASIGLLHVTRMQSSSSVGMATRRERDRFGNYSASRAQWVSTDCVKMNLSNLDRCKFHAFEYWWIVDESVIHRIVIFDDLNG